MKDYYIQKKGDKTARLKPQFVIRTQQQNTYFDKKEKKRRTLYTEKIQ